MNKHSNLHLITFNTQHNVFKEITKSAICSCTLKNIRTELLYDRFSCPKASSIFNL